MFLTCACHIGNSRFLIPKLKQIGKLARKKNIKENINILGLYEVMELIPSSTLNILLVFPSPLSLASHCLHEKL